MRGQPPRGCDAVVEPLRIRMLRGERVVEREDARAQAFRQLAREPVDECADLWIHGYFMAVFFIWQVEASAVSGPGILWSVRNPNSFVPSALNFTVFPSTLAKVPMKIGWMNW